MCGIFGALGDSKDGVWEISWLHRRQSDPIEGTFDPKEDTMWKTTDEFAKSSGEKVMAHTFDER